MRYAGVTIAALLMGVLVLSPSICTSVFRQQPRAHFSSGQQAVGEQIKTPLTGKVKVRQRRGRVDFLFKLSDAENREVSTLQLRSGQRPKPPKVVVFDAHGERVYACTLEYG